MKDINTNTTIFYVRRAVRKGVETFVIMSGNNWTMLYLGYQIWERVEQTLCRIMIMEPVILDIEDVSWWKGNRQIEYCLDWFVK